MLPEPLTTAALADAMAESNPDSLAAATRLRRRYPPQVAAAALEQASLRQHAAVKFGSAAAGMFFTRDGLEQATRPAIAAHHADRFTAAGVRRVVDLGCGIGSDAMAVADAGLSVTAVERDPHTAEIAEANLSNVEATEGGASVADNWRGISVDVAAGDAERLAAALIGTGDGVFADPSRRTAAGRVWRTTDFSPRWDLVLRLLSGERPAGIKLGPGIPHSQIPGGVEAEWVSDRGETVEVTLWAGPGSEPEQRAALIMPDHRLPTDPSATVDVAPPGSYIYEPAGAVIRAGGIATLAQRIGGWLLDSQIAYLSSDHATPTPYATGFRIVEVLPYREKDLRSWVRDHRVGRLEIKKRGIDVDPAALRRRLRPTGDESATMIIARTTDGRKVLICERISPPAKL